MYISTIDTTKCIAWKVIDTHPRLHLLQMLQVCSNGDNLRCNSTEALDFRNSQDINFVLKSKFRHQGSSMISVHLSDPVTNVRIIDPMNIAPRAPCKLCSLESAKP